MGGKRRGRGNDEGGPAGGNGGGGRPADAARHAQLLVDERHEPLQAVVVADSFETRFEPFIAHKPRCLLPLLNRPIIDYTLESLENAGVEEIILYAGAHADQLEEYLNDSKWRSHLSPFTKFRFIRSDSTSVGEAMRDLHGKHLMSGDFIIIHGDVVSNYPIEKAIQEHKARRAKDKNAIMTMVLRELGPVHRTKSSPTSPVFVIDPAHDRCLHYEEISRHPRQPPREDDNDTAAVATTSPSSELLSLDPELLDYPELDLRNDLYDCGIDICTPEVLGLWADSFDYQTPRSQFLHGVLKDYELNGKTIHTHVINGHYAARAHNLKAYDAVSKDIISRWPYPFCPDTNLGENEHYTFKRRQVYLDQNVDLSRQAAVRQDSVIGSQTTVGGKTVIADSVVGTNCRIGHNVVLENAYLWKGVEVGDNAEIRHAIVADGAVIGSGCRLEPGSLISYGVKIADGVTIPKGMRVARDAAAEPDEGVVGSGGDGREFVSELEDEEPEDPVMSSLLYNMADLSVSTDSISTLSSDAWDEESSSLTRSRAGSFETALSEEDAFHNDAVHSIYDGLKDGLSSDVVHLELVGLRMSSNASEEQVRKAVVASFMRRIQQLIDEGAGASEAVNTVLAKYKEIIDRIVFDRDSSSDAKPDQVDLLLQFQRDIAGREKGGTILLFTAKELYDLEIVDEEAFGQWWAREEATESEAMEKVRTQTQPFIDWLESADSESEEEEEEEESDEESE